MMDSCVSVARGLLATKARNRDARVGVSRDSTAARRLVLALATALVLALAIATPSQYKAWTSVLPYGVGTTAT